MPDTSARRGAGAGWAVFDPARGTVYAQVAAGDAQDVADAVAAAGAAFPAWSALANDARARWLERLADALEARQDDFAHAEARDGGKPYALARDAEIRARSPTCVSSRTPRPSSPASRTTARPA